MDVSYGKLLSHLGHGLANIRSSYELAGLMKVPQRRIGFIVNRLRQEGHLIGSAPSRGYYWITDESELAETLAHIEGRKRGIDRTLTALRQSWVQQEQQS